MYRKDNKLQTKYEQYWIIYMNNETNINLNKINKL